MVQFALDGGVKLPSRNEVGYLDREIADEGQAVKLSDGENLSWTPPPEKLAMPDFSQVKSIRKYFNRTGYQVYPAWLYHPKEPARIVNNSDEAMALGVFYREATTEERGRYGVKAVWDWKPECQWRPTPWSETRTIDPMNPGAGKNFVHREESRAVAQNALVEALIPQVAAAVAQALKSSGPSAPAHIDAKEWEQFIAFQAWQKTQSAVKEVFVPEIAHELIDDTVSLEGDDAGDNGLTHEQEMALWAAEAERKGVKVDKRWGLARLKEEVEKAA